QEFGLEGIRKLKKNMVNALHPAQMVKSAQNSKVTPPAISIMPYFFTKMVVPGGVMEAVWPQDGAILSPIFMLTKASKKAELQDLANTLVSKELGEILAHQGLFPSINQEVDNRLPGKPYKWVGWDFINNHDIGALLKQLMEEFYKED
ncbi:MAG: ABC transporter substrate-binding protein, partial [Erysipelotrichaceae bacterium]